MKKISVIVPCYNAAAYLDKCMEHLYRQAAEYDADIVQFQVKVVCDGIDISDIDVKEEGEGYCF